VSNVKKMSPVVPVAPFKEDKKDEDDENRHLIFTKKDVNSKPKPRRVRDYGEVKVDDSSKNVMNEDKSGDNEAKNLTHTSVVENQNKNNLSHAKGRAPGIPGRRPSEEDVVYSTKMENPWRDMLKPVASPRIEDADSHVTLVPIEEPRRADTVREEKVSMTTTTTEVKNSMQTVKESALPVKPGRPARTYLNKLDEKRGAELERKVPEELTRPVPVSVSAARSEEQRVPKLDLSKPSAPVVPALNLGGVDDDEDEKMEEEESEQNGAAESDEPVRGIPSIIARRMKQNGESSSKEQVTPSRPGELFGVRLGKTRHPDDSSDAANEIPVKRAAPEIVKATPPPNDTSSSTSGLPEEIENEIASVRRRMQQEKNKKSSGVSQIFDSSQLAKKRKEKQAAKSNAGVPRLDLSAITDADTNDGSQGLYRVTPREIKPCNIEFIGANAKTNRSLLHKKRTVKVGTF
jgi:hypothetical protein